MQAAVVQTHLGAAQGPLEETIHVQLRSL